MFFAAIIISIILNLSNAENIYGESSMYSFDVPGQPICTGEADVSYYSPCSLYYPSLGPDSPSTYCVHDYVACCCAHCLECIDPSNSEEPTLEPTLEPSPEPTLVPTPEPTLENDYCFISECGCPGSFLQAWCTEENAALGHSDSSYCHLSEQGCLSCNGMWCPPTTFEPTFQPTEATLEPTDATMEPTLATLEPTDATREPTDATMEPTSATLEPTVATMEPTSATLEPTVATMEPTDATMEPTSATLEPTDATMEPTDATMEPTSATLEPTDATMEPTDATMEPTSITLEPTDATMEPTAATLEPTAATLEPTVVITLQPTPATLEPTPQPTAAALETMPPVDEGLVVVNTEPAVPAANLGDSSTLSVSVELLLGFVFISFWILCCGGFWVYYKGSSNKTDKQVAKYLQDVPSLTPKVIETEPKQIEVIIAQPNSVINMDELATEGTGSGPTPGSTDDVTPGEHVTPGEGYGQTGSRSGTCSSMESATYAHAAHLDRPRNSTVDTAASLGSIHDSYFNDEEDTSMDLYEDTFAKVACAREGFAPSGAPGGNNEPRMSEGGMVTGFDAHKMMRNNVVDKVFDNFDVSFNATLKKKQQQKQRLPPLSLADSLHNDDALDHALDIPIAGFDSENGKAMQQGCSELTLMESDEFNVYSY